MSSLRSTIERVMYNSRLPREVLGIYLLLWMAATTRWPFGRNVYEYDWDMLVVLDACRVDALHSVADEYEYLGDIGEITSVGSTSLEWMLKTFTEDHRRAIEETRYVSTNGHLGHLSGSSTSYFSFSPLRETMVANFEESNRLVNRNVVSESDFAAVDRLYSLSERNSYGHTPLPDDVTDYAIRIGRESSPGRLIVHYMQPHAPYLKEAIERGHIERYEESPFDALREGVAFETVWGAYIDNLRLVLDSVERLLENFEAENVAITADHGDLFGEWGLYSHAAGVFHPDLKRVPWVEAVAHDTGEYTPKVRYRAEHTDGVQEQAQRQLEALGYV